MDFFANVFGKASEPAGTPPADPKKVRRSVRVRGTTVDEAPSSPPPQNVPNAQASSEDLLAPISPPARSEIRHTPVASPPPQSNDTQISTQVASQFAYIPPQDDEEYDPNVWGYLDPINSTSYKSIRLNKNPQEPVEKKRGRGASRKTGPRGFLIGRHAECDLQIDSGVISNRHCVIYKVQLSTDFRF